MGEAYNKESSAISFYNNTRNFGSSSPALMLGFKAIAELMMCKHVQNPLTKLSYFKKGKNHLEEAISLDDKNPELRFMRFCTQVNTPSMLGYNEAIKIDKQFLIQYLTVQHAAFKKDDEALYINIKAFLLNCKFCSDAEKKIVKNL